MKKDEKCKNKQIKQKFTKRERRKARQQQPWTQNMDASEIVKGSGKVLASVL